MAKENGNLVDDVVRRYDGEVGLLIPMLQDLQAARGYLPVPELERLAERLDLPLSRLFAVATFYTSFRLAPKGQHEVTLCVGTVCHLKGAGVISEMIQEEFLVAAGGTTPDGLFSFQPVNCVGACALAPVMIVDGKYYDGVTKDAARKLLRGLPMAEPQAAGEDKK